MTTKQFSSSHRTVKFYIIYSIVQLIKWYTAVLWGLQCWEFFNIIRDLHLCLCVLLGTSICVQWELSPRHQKSCTEAKACLLFWLYTMCWRRDQQQDRLCIIVHNVVDSFIFALVLILHKISSFCQFMTEYMLCSILSSLLLHIVTARLYCTNPCNPCTNPTAFHPRKVLYTPQMLIV